MTPVPRSALRRRVSTRPLTGSSAYGPVWGATRHGVRCRLEGRRRRVLRPGGVEVISSASIVVRPGDEVPVGSQVIDGARTYEVIEVIVAEGLSRPAYYELVLT